MSDPTKKQVAAANWLLKQSSGQPEDYIRKRIGDLLGSMDIDYELSYPTESGPADIYLPRRRTIIETKAVGLADHPDKPQARTSNESPREQLERYLRAETAYELMHLPSESASKRPWTGILTDGRIWHVWRYAHEEKAPGTVVDAGYRPTTPTALIDRLRHTLQGDVVGKPWVPADPRPIFEPWLEELRELHANLSGDAEKRTQTKRHLWIEMLRVSSMEPENEAARQRLFVAHSFLVALARGVIHVLANLNAPPCTEDIFGDGFVSWVVETTKGKQWGDRFAREIQGYEWRRRPGDVLRPLYEQFVDERDRKAFGEFYTPDWLAELLVYDICDEDWCTSAIEKALVAQSEGMDLKGVGLLDPTCGSGTFLYHAAKRILASPAMAGLANSHKSAVVCSLVHGIDVHPVAAEIARATLLRALPAEPPHGKADLRIHEGDALLIRGDDENSLFQPTNGAIRIETPKGFNVLFPKSFVDGPNFSDNLRRLVLSAANRKPLPKDIANAVPSSDRKMMEECHQTFSDIIVDEGDSVWTWYIRNIMGPRLLSEKKVDRIVANPPWVNMAKVQARSRKRALEKFSASTDINLWPGGKQAPHFDIAQLFVKRSRQLYLAHPDNDPTAWLVKKAALKSGNWEKFRRWHKKVSKQTIDLEGIKPFGGGDARRCCVLFDGRPSSLKPRRKKHLVARIKGSLPSPHSNLDDVKERLSFHAAPTPIPRAPSDYISPRGDPLFRQGATITPKVLTVLGDIVEAEHPDFLSVITARSQHPPWLDIEPQEGIVPRAWIRNLITSKSLLPFALSSRNQLHALVPTDARGNLHESTLTDSDFWQRLDTIYKENKGAGTGTPKSLIAQIDYSSKLSSQLHLSGNLRTMVIYPSSGDVMRACRLRPGDAIIDFTLYRFSACSASEAAYLVALLNAPCLINAFAQSRAGGRDFHLNPWRAIPIRRYDKGNSAHVDLAKLTVQAERLCNVWLSNPESSTGHLGQVALSKRLRELLLEKGIFDQIDRLARKILPRQARII